MTGVQTCALPISVFNQLLPDGNRSATYRCVFPSPPDPMETVDCKVAGVFGFLPGMIGSWMAAEAIKLISSKHIESTFMVFDAQSNSLQKLNMVRNPENWGSIPKSATEISCFNYGAFCSRLT